MLGGTGSSKGSTGKSIGRTGLCLKVYWDVLGGVLAILGAYWEVLGVYWGSPRPLDPPRGSCDPRTRRRSCGERGAPCGVGTGGPAPATTGLGSNGTPGDLRGGTSGVGVTKTPPQTPKNEFFTPSSPTGGATHKFLGHDAVLEVGVAGEEEPDPAAGPGGAEFFHLQDPQSINPSWGGSKFIWGGSQNPKNPPPGTCRPVM